MKLNSRVLSSLIAFSLVAVPLLGYGAAAEQAASSGTEVVVPDGTVIKAKLRGAFDAKKAQVGDTAELEVLEDVQSQGATTVLIPKKAKLLCKVSAVEPAKEKNEAIVVSMEVVGAQWKGAFARLSAVITDAQFMVESQGGEHEYLNTCALPPPQVCRDIPATGQTEDVRMNNGVFVNKPGDSKSATTTHLAEGKLWFPPPYRMASGSAFLLQNLSLQGPAERGDAGAQFRLGLMYHQGGRVPQNYGQAAEWYRKAAEQGFAQAQNNLAVLSAQGQGVAPDDVAAYMWFTLAEPAEPGKTKASLQFLESRMTPAQVAEGKRRAQEWLKQHPPAH